MLTNWSNVNILFVKKNLQIFSRMLACFLSTVCSLLLNIRSRSNECQLNSSQMTSFINLKLVLPKVISEFGPLVLYVFNLYEVDLWCTLWQNQDIHSNILIKLMLLVSHPPYSFKSVWNGAEPACKYFPLCIALSCPYYFSITIITVTESDSYIRKNLSYSA